MGPSCKSGEDWMKRGGKPSAKKGVQKGGNTENFSFAIKNTEKGRAN